MNRHGQQGTRRTRRTERRRPAVSRRALIGGGIILGAAAGAYAAAELIGGSGGVRTFVARFPHDGLVTNEYAFRRPQAPGARVSTDWVVTSGSLFARDGDGWTGTPDSGRTGPDSAEHTGSAVFRLVTRRRDFDGVSVRTRVRLAPPITTPRTPARDWDGGHLWLRYHSPQELYALSFRRRDGSVVIKRKVPAHDAAAVDGGDYATLAHAPHAITYDAWHHMAASAVTLPTGAVRLRLEIDGHTVLTTDDRTPGPLGTPGRVGLRADNTELFFRGFRAAPLAPALLKADGSWAYLDGAVSR